MIEGVEEEKKVESEGTLEFEFEEYPREFEDEELPLFDEEEEDERYKSKLEPEKLDFQTTNIEPVHKPSVIKKVIEVFKDEMDFNDPLKDDFQPLIKQKELPEETMQMLLKQANKAMRLKSQNNLDFLDWLFF